METRPERCLDCGATLPPDTPNVWRPSGPLARSRGWVFCPACARGMADVRRDGFETVSHCGKFEGEAPFVPMFYERGLDGDGAGERYAGDALVSEYFTVSAEDRATFPELKGRRTVRLHYSESGFVSE